MLGLILGAIITAIIIAGLIYLGMKGHLMMRFGGKNMKDVKMEEEDKETRKSETLKEARKAELGNLQNIKSVSVDGEAPPICPSCKATQPDWKNIKSDNKGFQKVKQKYKYHCNKCGYSNAYEKLHT